MIEGPAYRGRRCRSRRKSPVPITIPMVVSSSGRLARSRLRRPPGAFVVALGGRAQDVVYGLRAGEVHAGVIPVRAGGYASNGG